MCPCPVHSVQAQPHQRESPVPTDISLWGPTNPLIQKKSKQFNKLLILGHFENMDYDIRICQSDNLPINYKWDEQNYNFI